MTAIVISCVALAVSIIAAGYAAREAVAVERRLRDETDAPRSTFFRIMIYNLDRYAEGSCDDAVVYPCVFVENMGGVEAKDVELVVTATDSKERWNAQATFLARGDTLEVKLGRSVDPRLFGVKVSWKDGRRLRQRYRRTMQSER